MSWTEKRVQTLETLWRAGKSASEIAETLGGVTRNAVIGKAHRMGLSGRPSPIKKVKEKTATPAAAETPRGAAAPSGRSKPVVIASGEKKKAGGGVSILQLTERMCKWPSGDPREEDFHFCGLASKPGMPYCAEHVATAYQSGGRNSNRNTSAAAAIVVAEVPAEVADIVDDEADAA